MNRERRSEYNREWHIQNPEYRWRYYIATRRPRDLAAQRERVVEQLRQLEEEGTTA